MKQIVVSLVLLFSGVFALKAQTLTEAKELYKVGEYAKALPAFGREYKEKPNDASLNYWYGICLLMTGGNLDKAEECLKLASKRKVREANFFLGQLYTQQYRFTEAAGAYDAYESSLKKRGDDDARALLEQKRKTMLRLNRMVSNAEDIQIIDSLVVPKNTFLSAYKLSSSNGKIEYFNQVFSANQKVDATVYFNEKESKIYFAQPDTSGVYSLYSMDKLLDKFGNEKRLSSDNFNLNGNLNYPYVLTDGVTVYFAACDEMSIGGYDLFVSRYNMNNDTYLVPERLNMPFNSEYNDYMMVVDDEKGVGWFASDRFQPEDSVCVYTFIPNSSVKVIESDDEAYKARRALITSIRESWADGHDYVNIINLARKEPFVKKKAVRDFTFVINDKHTYYTLAEFKNKEARDTYFKIIQTKSELQTVEKDLDKLRDEYARMTNDLKRRTASSIISLEKQQQQLLQLIPELEKHARNEEIKVIGE